MTIDQQMDDDAKALAELGYTQELHRGVSGFSNFAVSFSIISILAGCITSYGIALRSGGPSTLVLGWLLVGIMVLAVAAAVAEVCSRYPTAVAFTSTSGPVGLRGRIGASGPGTPAGSTSWARWP